MGLLAGVRSPEDLRRLDSGQLPELAAEIRDFLVRKVARTGGHLGPNLGVVELTLALHRVFDSPREPIVFDTGHQSYVHKMLTGRQAAFDDLRQQGGLSGYPSRSESEHDLVENSHASTALSYADGLAKAFEIRGERRCVVAVVGDGALTGGMCWEALNNIAAARHRPMVIVVNDNGRSYSPTIGGLAERLAALRLRPGYERGLDLAKNVLSRTPVVGKPLYDALHGVKRGMKDILAPEGMFEGLGLKYVGPVDGHDVEAVERALRRARAFGGPVILHCVTRKGFGYPPAENDEADCLHVARVFDPMTGVPVGGPSVGWTDVFGEELVRLGGERDDIVAITAAMRDPVGMTAFATTYPTRFYDVGIAEQHAVTSAAGLAMGGMHPVVGLYATFLNRAFDQVLFDVALHKLPVTFCLDRSGVTGEDGPSHHGQWDVAMLSAVPGLRLAAPRDGATLREELREAVAHSDGPTVLRYAKGSVPDDVPALERTEAGDILRRGARPEVLLVAVGAFAGLALDVAERAAAQGVEVTVVDPRWVLPVADGLVRTAASYDLVVTVEDGLRRGGVGTALAQVLRDAGAATVTREVGLPGEFLAVGARAQVLERVGLTAQDVARRLVEWAIALLPAEREASVPAATDGDASAGPDAKAGTERPIIRGRDTTARPES